MADDNQPRSQEQLPQDHQPPGSKGPAPKDKNCPFCHQPFTSSSLGRHLDLYIKPKNPKAPDGIHNVDEIRRMRGGITRRQARNSLARKGDSSGASTPVSLQQQPPPPQPTAPQQVPPPVQQQQHQHQQASQQGQPQNPSVSAVSADTASPVVTQSPTLNINPPPQKLRFQFNQPSWTSTGVINNLPPRASVSSETGKATRHELHKRGLENRQMISDEIDHGRAAELALKEVLASVRDASARSAGVNLFDFDPYTLSFPSLCLHILPAPATLFSPSPFPNSESWSITPPGQKQFDALNKNIRDRLVQRQRHSQLFGATNPLVGTPSASAASPLPTPPLGGFDPDPQRLFQHLQDAYNHWKTLSDKQRQETWTLEILRSYTRADESRREAENSLANAKKEIETLKNNRWINMGMASSTTAAGGAQSPSTSLPVPTEIFKELAGKNVQGLDPRTWDYDKLMEKWTTVVKENKKTMLGLANQRSLSTGSVPASTPVSTSSMNATNGNTTPISCGGSVLSTSIHHVGMNGTSAGAMGTPTALVPPSMGTNGFSVSQNSRDGVVDSDATDVIDPDGDEDDADADADAETVISPENAPQQQQQPSLQQQQQSHAQRQQQHAHHQQLSQHHQPPHPQQRPQHPQNPSPLHQPLPPQQLTQQQMSQQPLGTPSLPGQPPQHQHSQPPTPHNQQPPPQHQPWPGMAAPTHPSTHFPGLQGMTGLPSGKGPRILPETTGPVVGTVGPNGALMEGIELQAHPGNVGGPDAFMTGAPGWG
ncbi:hypothetical protein SLS54_000806 [Diplodia seriata]|uniref:Uncharacterized protein n=1 Tax=Diplodia seriata TaxID=420778 RepID=A0A1S8BGP9_9PEZI|nr:hypothetical protein BK809_0003797 [Diplodia seriata]